MKTVHSNHGVPQAWLAHNANPASLNGYGRNARYSIFYDGDTIYSYGRHFPIARIVNEPSGKQHVIFTPLKYSRTTSRHCSIVRRAIHEAGLSIVTGVV